MRKRSAALPGLPLGECQYGSVWLLVYRPAAVCGFSTDLADDDVDEGGDVVLTTLLVRRSCDIRLLRTLLPGDDEDDDDIKEEDDDPAAAVVTDCVEVVIVVLWALLRLARRARATAEVFTLDTPLSAGVEVRDGVRLGLG